jgi:hypothetical protein
MSTILQAGNATSGAVVSSDTAGSLQIQTGSTPTTAITVDSSQNVGIGASPVDKLTVVTTGSAQSKIDSYETVQFRDSNVAYLRVSGGSVDTLVGSETSGGTSFIGTYTNSPVTFRTNNTEKMRIDSNGRWMVNTSTALNSGTARGSILFNGSAEQGLFIASSAGATPQCMGFNYNTTTNVGSINITSSSTSYVTSSDYRLKENVAPMTGALDKVSQLKPCTYDWIADKSKGQGFIAHELQAVVPECVIGEKDAVDAEGKPLYQGVDTSFLVATLTAAIQELNATVTAQAAQIAALQAKVGA